MNWKIKLVVASLVLCESGVVFGGCPTLKELESSCTKGKKAVISLQLNPARAPEWSGAEPMIDDFCYFKKWECLPAQSLGTDSIEKESELIKKLDAGIPVSVDRITAGLRERLERKQERRAAEFEKKIQQIATVFLQKRDFCRQKTVALGCMSDFAKAQCAFSTLRLEVLVESVYSGKFEHDDLHGFIERMRDWSRNDSEPYYYNPGYEIRQILTRVESEDVPLKDYTLLSVQHRILEFGARCRASTLSAKIQETESKGALTPGASSPYKEPVPAKPGTTVPR